MKDGRVMLTLLDMAADTEIAFFRRSFRQTRINLPEKMLSMSFIYFFIVFGSSGASFI
jgi:hypothetical protein